MLEMKKWSGHRPPARPVFDRDACLAVAQVIIAGQAVKLDDADLHARGHQGLDSAQNNRCFAARWWSGNGNQFHWPAACFRGSLTSGKNMSSISALTFNRSCWRRKSHPSQRRGLALDFSLNTGMRDREARTYQRFSQTGAGQVVGGSASVPRHGNF